MACFSNILKNIATAFSCAIFFNTFLHFFFTLFTFFTLILQNIATLSRNTAGITGIKTPVLEIDYRGYHGRRTKDILEDQKAGGPKKSIAEEARGPISALFIE